MENEVAKRLGISADDWDINARRDVEESPLNSFLRARLKEWLSSVVSPLDPAQITHIARVETARSYEAGNTAKSAPKSGPNWRSL
jgi:hypothetical protein